MRNAWLLVVAAGLAGTAVLIATCGSPQPDATDGASDTSVARPGTASRSRSEEPSDAAPAESGSSAHEATPPAWRPSVDTTLLPEGSRVATPMHTLRGHVVRASGEPARGARVRLTSRWFSWEVDTFWKPSMGRARAETWTDSSGTFSLPYWEGGPRSLVVSDRGGDVDGCADWYATDPSDDRVVEIVLPDKPRSMVVHVTSATDDSPVTGAEGTVTWGTSNRPNARRNDDPALGPGETWVHAAPPGPEGELWFFQVPAGTVTVDVFAPGFAPALDRRLVVPSDADATLDVKLVRGLTLRGNVVDAESGRGIAGVGIALGSKWPHDQRDEVYTDASGHFLMEHVPLAPNVFETFVAKEGDDYGEACFVAGVRDPSATECEVTVRMFRSATVNVRCVDAEQRPMKHVVVAVFSDYDATPSNGMRTTLTSTIAERSESDGRATLTRVIPGTDGLELRTRFHVDGVPVLERTYPPLRPGETRDLGDVVLAPTLTLRGTLLDADGKPVAGATVVAAPNDAADEHHAALGAAVMERGGRRAETQPDGSFALTGLGKGLWDLYAYASWESPGRLEPGVDPARGTVTLRLPRVVALSGRVLDASGAPVAKANVASYRAFFGMRMSVSCLSTADGTFGIPGYAEGTPEVEVAVTPREGADAQEFKARPGAAGTELRLR